MKWGLVARCDDRGLGHITWEVHRNLRPDRVLIVDMGGRARGFVQRPERYDDAPESWTVRYGEFDETAVRDFIDGLDVVYSAETFYDPSFVPWANQAGVATVLHVMPEFYDPAALEQPSTVWAPTTWRLDHLPADARVVPVPVALDRFPTPAEPHDGPARVLHVAGHRAAHDRNGTTTLYQALRLLRNPVDVTVRCQDRTLPSPPRPLPKGVKVSRTIGPAVGCYWELYDGADVLVMPRRYGGLCLPVQEAAAAGLAIVLPDVEPNTTWPSARVWATPRGRFRTANGELVMHETDFRSLAATIDVMAQPNVREAWGAQARSWAEAHSWEALADVWRDELARACR